MTDTMTGGCQCGQVRYSVEVNDDEAYLCHCRMCQRATGGVAAAMKGVRKADVTWSGEPDWYRSSPIASRPFCATCGTPLGFAFPDSDTMDLLVGTFDDPYRLRPTRHYATESLHEGWVDTSALPRLRTEDNPTVANRWITACGKLPD